ncbi:MAG: SMC-Scp complex subunit ScpB [Ruminococcaceae bacterium]|nr:SMC-Scp complex subunit ScpB [Oscillospiraceae bacterium]
MEINEICSAVEAILFASGESVPVSRIAKVLGVNEAEIYAAADSLAAEYESALRGIRLLKLDTSLQLCSAKEYSQLVTMALETRKSPKLSPSSLEVLAIVAYYQPVTRAYVDQVRGVDSSYTLSVLVEKGLIEPCGKLDVPGRPTIYKTGEVFLRTMGISSVDELPALPDIASDEGIIELQNKIDALRSGELEGQMSFDQ